MKAVRPVDGSAGDLPGEPSVLRSEEELDLGTRSVEAGRVQVRKVVDRHHVEDVVPRGVEHAEVERVGTTEGDSGEIETLADGTVSVPVFEEVLVVEKRLVVRERVLIRKHTVTEEHLVEADLRRERVEVEADRAVEGRVVDDTDTDLAS